MFLLDGFFFISVQFPIPIKMTVFVDQATHSSDGQISKLLTQSHSTWLTSSNILLLNIFNVIPKFQNVPYLILYHNLSPLYEQFEFPW